MRLGSGAEEAEGNGYDIGTIQKQDRDIDARFAMLVVQVANHTEPPIPNPQLQYPRSRNKSILTAPSAPPVPTHTYDGYQPASAAD